MLEVGKLKQSVLREYLSRAQQSLAAVAPDGHFDEQCNACLRWSIFHISVISLGMRILCQLNDASMLSWRVCFFLDVFMRKIFSYYESVCVFIQVFISRNFFHLNC